MFKKKDNTFNKRQEVENTNISQILEYLVHTARIAEMPNETVWILDVDPKELLGTMITGGIMRTAVIIYHTGDIYRLYNSQLILKGGIKGLKKIDGGCYQMETFGKELRPRTGGWVSSEFMNHLFIHFEVLKEKVEKKFEGVKSVYYKKM